MYSSCVSIWLLVYKVIIVFRYLKSQAIRECDLIDCRVNISVQTSQLKIRGELSIFCCFLSVEYRSGVSNQCPNYPMNTDHQSPAELPSLMQQQGL